MARKAKEMNQNKTNLEFDNNTLGPLEKTVGRNEPACRAFTWNLIGRDRENKTKHFKIKTFKI